MRFVGVFWVVVSGLLAPMQVAGQPRPGSSLPSKPEAVSSSTAAFHSSPRNTRPYVGTIHDIPWRMSGSLSLNWRNVGPRRPQFETQIQNEVFLADLFFAFHGPVIQDVPFWIEFQMPTGGQGQPNLYQFYFQHNKFDRWNIHLGKFLVPFGRYNELYKPDMFLTVTRPLLYSSPDSLDLVVRINSPRPPFSSGYSDIGGRVSYYPVGESVFVPNEMTFYVVNGLGEASNRSRTFPRPDNLGVPAPPPQGVSVDFGHENNNLADNNNNKAFGGRLVYSLGNLRFLPWPIPEGARDLDGFTLGLSGMGGQYDLEARMNYHMLGADLAFEYQGFNFAAEYMYSFNHFGSPLVASSSTLVSPTHLVRDFEEIHGYFVQASYPLLRKPRWGKRVTGVAVYNQIFRRGPLLELFLNQTVNGTVFPSIAAYNPAEPRFNTRIDKLTLALNHQMTSNFISKLDYSYWVMRHSTGQFGGVDIYQVAFSVVLSF